MTEKGESREKRAINSIITSLSKIDTKNQSFKNTELTTKDQKSKTWNKNQTLKCTIENKMENNYFKNLDAYKWL